MPVGESVSMLPIKNENIGRSTTPPCDAQQKNSKAARHKPDGDMAQAATIRRIRHSGMPIEVSVRVAHAEMRRADGL